MTLGIQVLRVFVYCETMLSSLDLYQFALDLKVGTAVREDSTGTKVSLVPYTMSVGAKISPSTGCGLIQNTSLNSARPCSKLGVKVTEPCSVSCYATSPSR